MPVVPGQPRFPLIRAVLCLAVTAALVLGGLVLVSGQVRPAALLACGGVWLLSVAGLIPVAMFGPRGVKPTVAGYFIGMFIRFLGTLGGVLVLSIVWAGQARPVVDAVAVTYLSLLVVEVAWVGRYLWMKDALVSGDGQALPDPLRGSITETESC